MTIKQNQSNHIGSLFDLTNRTDFVVVYPQSYNPLADSAFIYAYDPASSKNTFSTSSILVLADNRDSTPLDSGSFNSAPLIGTDVLLNNNQSIASFVSGANYHWQWNGPKSNFNFLHNGSGSTVFCVWRTQGVGGNNCIYDTNNTNTTSPGAALVHDGTNQRLIVRIANGVGSLVNLVTANETCLTGSRHYSCIRYLEGLTPNEINIRLNGTQIYSSSSLLAPTGSDSFGNFTVGQQSVSSGNNFIGSLGILLIANSYLSDAKVLKVENYIRARYALT